MSTIVWKSGYGGNWANASEWTVYGSSTHRVPGAGDEADIGIDGTANVVTFNSSGAVVGSIEEGANSTFDMLTGSLDITGQTGQTDFYGSLYVHGGTLTAGGVFTDEGTFSLNHGATFHVTNSGFAAVSTGVISGSIVVDSGATFQFGTGLDASPGSVTLTSAAIGGAGVLQVALGETVTANGQDTIGNAAYIDSSTIAGTGVLTFAGNVIFADTGGAAESQIGTGRTVLKGSDQINGGTLSPTAIGVDGGRTIENAKTLTFMNGGYLDLGFAGGSGTILNDKAGNILFVNGASSYGKVNFGNENGGILDFNGSSTLINDGTIAVYGSNPHYTDTISARLSNASTGLISVASGTLDLSGGGTLGGRLFGTAGATIQLGGGSFALVGVTSGLSAGDLVLTAGTLSVASGTTAAVGMQFAQSGGVIAGSNGVLVLANGADFRAGTDVETGSALTILYGSSLVDAGSAVDLENGRVLYNGGTLDWRGGNLTLGYGGGGGKLANAAGALIDITGGGNVTDGGGTTALINKGTIVNDSGTATTTIGVSLTNSSTGVIGVNSGTLNLTDGGVLAGSMVTNSTGTLELSGGSFALSGSSTLSSGVIALSGAILTVGSATSATIGAAFFQAGGAVEGPGTLSLANGGVFLAGSDEQLLGGRTVLDKTSVILHGAGLDLDDGRVLENAGTLLWDGNISLGFAGGTGGTVRNDAGGVMQIIQDGGAMYAFGGSDSFVNAGTLLKSSGTATTTIGATLTNAGTILASSGVIDFTGGGSSAGVLIAQNKAAIEFGGGYFSIKNVSAAGTSAGFIELTAGTLGVAGSLTASLGSEFYQSNGTIAGTGTLQLSGGAIFASGSDAEVGTGKTLLKASSTIRSGADVLLDGGRTLENANVLRWQGGDLDFGFAGGAGGTLVNDAGAALEINQAGDAIYFSGGADAVINNGLIATYGAGTTPTNIGVSLTNASTGQISVTKGILALNAGGYLSGTIAASAGATLALGGGYFTLSAGSTNTSAGTVLLSGGTASVAAGNTATIGSHFAQSGGSIGGAGVLTLANGSSFLSGTDAEIGTGRTVLKGATSVVSGAAIDLDGGRVLDNTGALTWTGGSFSLGFAGGSGATLENAAGATFNVRQDAGSVYNSGGTNALINAGTLIKSSGTGTTDVGVSLINGGTIIAASGVLDFSAGGSSAGVLEATSHGTLEFGGGYFSIKNASAAGDGTGVIELTGGTLGVAAGLTATLDSKFVQTGGEIAGAGTLVLATGFEFSSGASLNGIGPGSTVLKSRSTIDVNLALAFDNGRTLENAGTLSWYAGTGSVIRLGAYGNNLGATIRNDAGAVFSVAGDSNYGIVASAGTDSFVNAGTLIKSAGTGANTIGVSLTNTGTILAASGVLNLSGGGTSTGVLLATTHGTLDVSGGYFSIQNTSGTGDGTGLIEITGGTLGAAAGLTGTLDTRFRQAGGVLGGAGKLVLAGGIDIASGASDMFGSGTTVLEGVSTIEAYAALAFDGGHVVENSGSLTWQGGRFSVIRMGAYSNNIGATIRNDAGAVFAITGDSNYGIVPSAGTDSFVNAGTLIKSGGTGVNTIGVVLVNTGTISAASGVLALSGGGTSTGLLTAAKGGTLDINAGHLIVSGISASAGSVANGGIIEISGSGDIEGDSSASLDTRFLQEGGTIGGTGTLVLAKGIEFVASGVDEGFGTGTTLLEGSSTIDSGASLAFDSGHTLENAGTLTMNAERSIIRMGAYGNNAGATIRNDAGAVFDIVSYADYGIVASAGTDSFVNAGTLLKSGDTGAINIGIALVNSGTVTATAGTLDLSGGGNSTGVLTAAKGGTVDVSGGTLIVSGISASAGSIANGGFIEVSGSGDFEVDTSASLDTKFLQEGGTLGGTGTLVLAKGIEFASGGVDLGLGVGTTLLKGSSTIDGGASLALDSGHTLENAGTLTWDGGLNIIRMGAYGNGTGATIRNDAGAVFDIVGISNYGITPVSGTNSLVNAGLLEQSSAATGQTIIPIAITNTATGTIAVLAGDIDFTGAGNSLAGTVDGSASLLINNTTAIAGSLTIGGAVTVTNDSTIDQAGDITIGDAKGSKASFVNAAGGVFRIDNNFDIHGFTGAAGALFENDGLLEKTGGGSSTLITVDLVNKGSIAIDAGGLMIGGVKNTLSGTISGNALGFSGGGSTIESGAVLSVKSLAISGPSTTVTLVESLDFAGAFSDTGGTLALGANTLTLGGTGSIGGAITGTGGLSITGTETIAPGAVLGIARMTLAAGSLTTVTGNLTFAGSLTEAAGAKFTIASGGTMNNAGAVVSGAKGGAVGISLGSGGLLTNQAAGAIDATAASAILVEMTGNGTIRNLGKIVASGSGAIGVDLLAAGTVDNFGTITGGAGGDAVLFHSASDVLIAEAGASFGGGIVGGGGTLQLAGSGGTLSGLGTNIGGFGTVDLLAGASRTFAGSSTVGGTFINAGTLVDSGILTLGGTSTLGGTISGAGTLTLTGGKATVTAAGLTVAHLTLGGGATVTLGQNLAYAGTLSDAGTISGTGTLTLSGIENFGTGAVLSVSHLAITGGTATIATPLPYAGTFTQTAGTIAFASGSNLSLGGTASFGGGTITGAGALITKGLVGLSSLSLAGGATWNDGGSVVATGALTLGNSGGGAGKLAVLAGATFNITGGGGIKVAAGGSGSVSNAGLFEQTGSGARVVTPGIANTGTIAVTAGILSLAGAITGTGKETIGAAGTLAFGGSVAAGQTISFASTSGGTLLLDDPSGTGLSFAGTISGFGGADQLLLPTFADSGSTMPTLGWTQSSGSEGTLTVTEGSHIAKVVLFGQYAASGFKPTAAGGGTAITYTAPTAQQAMLAPPHH